MSSSDANTISLEPPDRILLPEPLGTVRPVRTETQRWQRLGRAEGELVLGWSEASEVVRVEYHWVRRLARVNPAMSDVYTAELWAKRPSGDWYYMVLPGEACLHVVKHDKLRPLLLRQLGVDIGGPVSAGASPTP